MLLVDNLVLWSAEKWNISWQVSSSLALLKSGPKPVPWLPAHGGSYSGTMCNSSMDLLFSYCQPHNIFTTQRCIFLSSVFELGMPTMGNLPIKFRNKLHSLWFPRVIIDRMGSKSSYTWFSLCRLIWSITLKTFPLGFPNVLNSSYRQILWKSSFERPKKQDLLPGSVQKVRESALTFSPETWSSGFPC